MLDDQERAIKKLERQGLKREKFKCVKADIILDNGDILQVLDAQGETQYFLGSSNVMLTNGIITWLKRPQ